jgi:hypothetical protein
VPDRLVVAEPEKREKGSCVPVRCALLVLAALSFDATVALAQGPVPAVTGNARVDTLVRGSRSVSIGASSRDLRLEQRWAHG